LLKKDRKIIGNYNFTVGFATAGDYQGWHMKIVVCWETWIYSLFQRFTMCVSNYHREKLPFGGSLYNIFVFKLVNKWTQNQFNLSQNNFYVLYSLFTRWPNLSSWPVFILKIKKKYNV
jgi:hypothetical protein